MSEEAHVVRQAVAMSLPMWRRERMTRTERTPDEERAAVAARRTRAMLTYRTRMQTELTSDRQQVVVVSRAIVTCPTRTRLKVKRVPIVGAAARTLG
jgi:hypothetical protein